MALTTDEEEKIRVIINAYDEGQQVDDLPLSDDTIQDKTIEVFDEKTGTSGKMSIKGAVGMASAPYCGRVWDLDNSSPKAESWVGSLDMLRNLPDILGLGCYLVKNDHSRRKLDPTNHYRFATGETAKLDGSMGHYNWGWGKKFYIAFWTIGRKFYECVSLSPIAGQYNYVIPIGSISAAGHCCIDRTTGTLVNYVNNDPQYRGGNNDATRDGTYKTLCGRAVTSMTAEALRTAARKNGTGWMSGTMRHSSAVKVLFEIIFGTHDVQAAYNPNKDSDGLYQGGLGSGVTTIDYTNIWSAKFGVQAFLPTSAGIELGDACGVSNYEVKDDENILLYTAPIPVFFGLKNLHGYLWRHQDDEFGRVNEDTSITHLVAPSIYGTWTIGVETGMVALSTTPAKCEGYIKALSYDNLENFPTQIGATSGTRHCDYLWNTSGVTSGFRVVLRGCSAYYGSPSGLSGVSVGNAVSYSSVYLGSLLCEAVEEWPIEPVYAEVA